MKRYGLKLIRKPITKEWSASISIDPEGEYVRIDDIPNVYRATMIDKKGLTNLFANHLNIHKSMFENDLIELIDRIAGQDVYIMFTGKDAFELEDENYWLPPGSFTLLDG